MRPPGSARGSRVVVSPALDRPLHPALVGSGHVLRQRLELLHRPQVRLVELDRDRPRLAFPAPLHSKPDVRRPALARKGASEIGEAVVEEENWTRRRAKGSWDPFSAHQTTNPDDAAWKRDDLGHQVEEVVRCASPATGPEPRLG